jgi:hypothetical protein
MIKKIRHRSLPQGGFVIRRKTLYFRHNKELLKQTALYRAYFSSIKVLGIYAVLLLIVLLFVPGCEVGILLAALGMHAVWCAMKGTLNIRNDIAWLN